MGKTWALGLEPSLELNAQGFILNHAGAGLMLSHKTAPQVQSQVLFCSQIIPLFKCLILLDIYFRTWGFLASLSDSVWFCRCGGALAEAPAAVLCGLQSADEVQQPAQPALCWQLCGAGSACLVPRASGDHVCVTSLGSRGTAASITHLFLKILTLIYALAASAWNKDLMCVLDGETWNLHHGQQSSAQDSLGCFLGKLLQLW